MKHFTSILFVAEPHHDNSAAYRQAVSLATSNQANLSVVTIIDEIYKSKSALWSNQTGETIEELRRKQLKDLIQSEPTSPEDIALDVLIGKTVLEVITEVKRHGHDLVIKSAETIEGIGQLFGGSDLKLLRMCPCPVWITKGSSPGEDRQILAACDYSPDYPAADTLNGDILEIATSLALAEFAELHVVHAWELEHENMLRLSQARYTDAEVDAMAEEVRQERESWLNALVAKHCKAAEFLTPAIHLPKGDARYAIPDLVGKLDAELVVMGTLVRTGIPGFVIGNTAETVLNRIDSSVLAIKPPGFELPLV